MWSNSGYGNQTRHIVSRFQELGHEVAVFASFGLLGGALEYQDVTVYPGYKHMHGADVVGAHAKHSGADVVISLFDVWIFKKLRRTLPCPWVAWFPVDGDPVSPRIVEVLEEVDYPVSFSRHGQMSVQQAGKDCDFIPLGVDCDIYKPGDKYEAREELGIPTDCFLVTMVAANKSYPSRKSFPAALEAFARFQEKHEEARLYLHTEMVPKKEGVEIVPLIQTLDIPEQALIKPDFENMLVGIPDEEMARIYQASDVLLNPAMGEGFGLPIAEAQACGIPVIVQNVTSMTELLFNGVLISPVARVWIPKLDYWQYQASPQRILDALEQVYVLDDGQREEAGERGAEMIKARFDWDYVTEEFWKPFLERVEAELW